MDSRAAIAFSCQHCNRVCCWNCLEPDESIECVKTIANRYCEAPECRAAERAACNCFACRDGGPGHTSKSGEECAHYGVKFGKPFAILVEEPPSFHLPEGPPLRGICPNCGSDLDALRKRGVIGHALFGPGDVINTEKPS